MRYSCANRPCKLVGVSSLVAMRLNRIWWVVLMLLAAFLAVAWYDGGREEQRLIEQPVTLPEGAL